MSTARQPLGRHGTVQAGLTVELPRLAGTAAAAHRLLDELHVPANLADVTVTVDTRKTVVVTSSFAAELVAELNTRGARMVRSLWRNQALDQVLAAHRRHGRAYQRHDEPQHVRDPDPVPCAHR